MRLDEEGAISAVLALSLLNDVVRSFFHFPFCGHAYTASKHECAEDVFQTGVERIQAGLLDSGVD